MNVGICMTCNQPVLVVVLSFGTKEPVKHLRRGKEGMCKGERARTIMVSEMHDFSLSQLHGEARRTEARKRKVCSELRGLLCAVKLRRKEVVMFIRRDLEKRRGKTSKKKYISTISLQEWRAEEQRGHNEEGEAYVLIRVRMSRCSAFP